MAPGITGLLGGRPKDSPRVRLHSCLVPKTAVTVEVDLDGEVQMCAVPTTGGFDPASLVAVEAPMVEEHSLFAASAVCRIVPLVELAVARSGDKGNHANIGVIARDARYLPWLRTALTESAVADYMRHVLDPVSGQVTRWELPGLGAFNFLLRNALGGGGIASLRMDPQGKAFAQQLLDFPVPVPVALLDAVRGRAESA